MKLECHIEAADRPLTGPSYSHVSDRCHTQAQLTARRHARVEMVDVRSVRIHGDRHSPPNPLGSAAGENGSTLRAEEEHRSATCRRNIEPSLSSVTSDPSNVDIVGYCHVTMKTFSYKKQYSNFLFIDESSNIFCRYEFHGIQSLAVICLFYYQLVCIYNCSSIE